MARLKRSVALSWMFAWRETKLPSGPRMPQTSTATWKLGEWHILRLESRLHSTLYGQTLHIIMFQHPSGDNRNALCLHVVVRPSVCPCMSASVMLFSRYMSFASIDCCQTFDGSAYRDTGELGTFYWSNVKGQGHHLTKYVKYHFGGLFLWYFWHVWWTFSQQAGVGIQNLM